MALQLVLDGPNDHFVINGAPTHLTGFYSFLLLVICLKIHILRIPDGFSVLLYFPDRAGIY